MQYSQDFTHDSQHKKMEHMQIVIANKRTGTPRPRLENTTPAVRIPGVIVKLESGGVRGCGKTNKKGTH